MSNNLKRMLRLPITSTPLSIGEGLGVKMFSRSCPPLGGGVRRTEEDFKPQTFILYLSFILIFGFQSLSALTPIEKAKTDFKKMNLVYASTPTFSLDIQYTVFDNHVNGNLIENKSGKYIKHKDASYTKLLDVITIVNAKNTIVVNNEDNMLVITDTKKIELSPIQTNMDTLLKMCQV